MANFAQKFVLKRILKILLLTLLSLIGLSVLISVLVNITPIQNFLVNKASSILTKKLNTEVSIDHVKFRLFNRFQLEGVYVEDQKKDTLLYVKDIDTRISNFFFLVKYPVLYDLTMNGTTAHISRNPGDSVWNYQFIIDAFAKPDKKENNDPLSLDLRKITLNEVHLTKEDAWAGENMRIGVHRLQLDAQRLNLPEHQLLIKKIEFDRPNFILEKYQGTAPEHLKEVLISELVDSSELRWNKENWDLQVGNIILKEGNFVLHDLDEKGRDSSFDARYINFKDINGNLTNIHLSQDSVISRLNLQTNERSGLQVKKLEGRFKLSPVTLELSDLDLETNQSRLTNFFALQFDDFEDLKDFTTKVTMRGDFDQAVVSSDDIAFFAPNLKDWKKTVEVSGLISGPLVDLNSDNLSVKSSDQTSLNASVSMNGLPDVDNTFMDVKINRLLTNGKELTQMIPALKASEGVDLASLGKIDFTGSVTGLIFDFVSYGDFKTGLGSFHSDLNLKYGTGFKVPNYSGSFSTSSFDLGTLLNLESLGKVSMTSEIDGKGFNIETLDSKVNGEISLLEFKKYPYQNIVLNGRMQKKLFEGEVNIEDPHLDLDFNGKIDFNGEVPEFDFVSNLRKSDWRTLHLTEDSIALTGKLKLDLSGNNLNDFVGEARLFDINLSNGNRRIPLDTVVIQSERDSLNNRLLTLEGNEINGRIKGQYDLNHLQNFTIYFLNKYLPNRIAPPKEMEHEKFTFSLNIVNGDSILAPLVPGFTDLKDGTIFGRVNTETDSLDLTMNLASIGYKAFRFNGVAIRTQGTKDSLVVNANLGSLYRQDSLLLPASTVQTHTHLDTSIIRINTIGSSSLSEADLSGRLITLEDGYNIKILNSEMNLNDKDWHISSDNEITLGKKKINIQDFKLFHKNQSISLVSKEKESEKNAFLMKLDHLYLGDITQYFLPNMQLEGLLDGEITIENPMGDIVIDGDLNIPELWINDDSIGSVTASGSYNKKESEVKWVFEKNDNPDHSFHTEGLVGLGDANDRIEGDFILNHMHLSLLDAFTSEMVSKLEGEATGKVSLTGKRTNPRVVGKVSLDQVGLEVNYTKVKYQIDHADIDFNPGKIELGTIILKDTLGQIGFLTGNITHSHFDRLLFNVNLNTRSLQFLNTTEKDNSVYYGNAVGSGRVDLTGPLKNLKMEINATPEEGTHLVLPLTDDQDIGKHDFITFKSYGKEIETKRPERKGETNLSVLLNANMTPAAIIDVIVDPTSGDHITASGNGSLQMNVDNRGNLEIFGNYAITEGRYVFSFKGLLSRDFDISTGSTIGWNGNPFDANINITAVYHVPGGVNLSNLVMDDASYLSGLDERDRRLLQQRERIDVQLSLKNSLLHPDITYDIQIPDASISASSLVMTRLQQIRQDPNLLINQVAALLAAGQFIPVNPGDNSSNIWKAGGLNAAGQWVSSQLNGVLNNLIGDQMNDLGLSFNMNYNTYSTTGNYGDIQRNDVQFNVSKRLFNNRVKIEVGPSVNWGRSNTAQAYSNSYFAGDFRFEYMITPDGKVRFLAFSQNDYDVLLNRNLTRSGIGIAYNRQFDKLHELFLSKKEKRRQDSLKNENVRLFMEREESEKEQQPTDN